MKKNSKGFTLVEVIATIGVLFLIAAITVPSILSIQSKNKEKNYEQLKETIVASAERYFQGNLKMPNSGKCYITLKTLANENLIKTPITNPITNEIISLNENYIEVTKENNIDGSIKIKYEYKQGNVNELSFDECTIKPEKEYVPGMPNKPELAEGLIPVIYHDIENAWVIADTTSEWYNYEEQMWANAVTVTTETRSTYMSASPGTEIPMDDINSMWVWIPRFKYRIPNTEDYDLNTNPPMIDVVFENGLSTTGVSEAKYKTGKENGDNTLYYTHPAFRDVEKIIYRDDSLSRGAWKEELTGFWVGKFTQDSTNIKPNTHIFIGNLFSTKLQTTLDYTGGVLNSDGSVTYNGSNTYGLGFNSSSESHMMKNTEWGAVAILSQSKYGKMGNSNYTGIHRKIFENNWWEHEFEHAMTGRSYDPRNDIQCSYDNYKCTSGDIDICSGDLIDGCGTGASTTGTIYGIYDMSLYNNHFDSVGVMVKLGTKNIMGQYPFNIDDEFYDSYNTSLMPGTTIYSLEKIIGDGSDISAWDTGNTCSTVTNTYTNIYRGNPSIFSCSAAGYVQKSSFYTVLTVLSQDV